MDWEAYMAVDDGHCAAIVKGDPVRVVISSVYCVEVPEVGSLHMKM